MVSAASFSQESKYVRQMTSSVEKTSLTFDTNFEKVEKTAQKKFSQIKQQFETSRLWKYGILVTVMTLSSFVCVASAVAFFIGLALQAEVIVGAAVVVGVVSGFFAVSLEGKVNFYQSMDSTWKARADLTYKAMTEMDKGNEEEAIRAILKGAYFEIPKNSKAATYLKGKNKQFTECNLLKKAENHQLSNAAFYIYLLSSPSFRKEAFRDNSLLNEGSDISSVQMGCMLYDIQKRECEKEIKQSPSETCNVATRVSTKQVDVQDSYLGNSFFEALFELDAKKIEVFVKSGFPLNKYLVTSTKKIKNEYTDMMPLEVLISSIYETISNDLDDQKKVDNALTALRLFLPEDYIKEPQKFTADNLVEDLNRKRQIGINLKWAEQLLRALALIAYKDEHRRLPMQYVGGKTPAPNRTLEAGFSESLRIAQ